MIYAYRRTRNLMGRRQIELFVSDTDRPAPAGFITCSWPRFRRAWQFSAALTFRRMRGQA